MKAATEADEGRRRPRSGGGWISSEAVGRGGAGPRRGSGRAGGRSNGEGGSDRGFAEPIEAYDLLPLRPPAKPTKAFVGLHPKAAEGSKGIEKALIEELQASKGTQEHTVTRVRGDAQAQEGC